MKNTVLILSLTVLGWAMAILFYIAYYNKPTEIVKQVNECTENHDLKAIETTGKLCNGQGGVLSSYRISDYSDEVSVSITCDFNKGSN